MVAGFQTKKVFVVDFFLCVFASEGIKVLLSWVISPLAFVVVFTPR